MSNNPLVLQPINGEPRIRDLDLAERLGFELPYDIRKLIKRNMANLLKFGVVFYDDSPATIRGGRPTKEFFLNKKQIEYTSAISRINKTKKKYLYVVEFSNKVIKVGNSNNIERRINDYKSQASIFGHTVTRYHASQDCVVLEKDLIELCLLKGKKYIANEYFVGVLFDDVFDFMLKNIY